MALGSILVILQTIALRETFRYNLQTDNRAVATQLEEKIEPQYDCLYNLATRRFDPVTCYFSRRVHEVKKVDDLPLKETLITMVSGEKAPVLETSKWTLLSKQKMKDGKYLSVWKGVPIP